LGLGLSSSALFPTKAKNNCGGDAMGNKTTASGEEDCPRQRNEVKSLEGKKGAGMKGKKRRE